MNNGGVPEREDVITDEYLKEEEEASSRERSRRQPTGSEIFREIRAGFELLRVMNGHGKSPAYIAWEKRFDSLAERIAACE